MTRPLARGWATVDHERAEHELREVIAAGSIFEEAPRSGLLGGSCRLARDPDDGWIVLLEPDTEGRVAGFLARHGEGWAATWERWTDPAIDPVGRAQDGPFGPEVLSADGSSIGPFLLYVMAATIDP